MKVFTLQEYLWCGACCMAIGVCATLGIIQERNKGRDCFNVKSVTYCEER